MHCAPITRPVAFHLSALLVLVALAALAALAPPAAAGHARHCGNIPGEGITPQRIRAYSVLCPRARKVADRAAKVPSFGGCAVDGGDYVRIKPGCRVLGFSCSSRKLVREFTRASRCAATAASRARRASGSDDGATPGHASVPRSQRNLDAGASRS